MRAEWEDRFGPLPAPAAALLDVARLRVECLRLGITDVAVTVPAGQRGRASAGTAAGPSAATVKLSPVTLPASAEVRLQRLAPGPTYQPDLHRLLVPMAVPSEHGADVRPRAGGAARRAGPGGGVGQALGSGGGGSAGRCLRGPTR